MKKLHINSTEFAKLFGEGDELEDFTLEADDEEEESPSKRLGAFDTGGGEVDGDLPKSKDTDDGEDDEDEEKEKSEDETEEVEEADDEGEGEDEDDEEEEEQREGHAVRLSALQKFRRSPEYAAMMNGTQESLNPPSAAQAIIEMCALDMSHNNILNVLHGKPLTEDGSKHSFVNSVIVACIDAGLNPNLVEVETNKEGRVFVYLDDRVTDKLEEIDNLLTQYGEVKLLKRPEDDRVLGTYLFSVAKSANKSPHAQATGREQIGSIPSGRGTNATASKNSDLHLY